jgi:hypothetical protein
VIARRPDVAALAALRVDGVDPGPLVRARSEFGEPGVPEVVLAFDQSFHATGMVLMRFGSTNPVDIMAATTFTTATDLTGSLADLEQAEQLHDQIYTTLNKVPVAHFTKAFYETPPKGGAIRNPEVSLLSALAVRWAVRRVTKDRIRAQAVSAKTWKKMTTGNANLRTKKTAHDAVAKWDWLRGYELATNASQRDAVMVGLGGMWKEQ